MGDARVRLFEPSEWAMYRDVRLRALLSDPAVFSSSHAIESVRTDAQWQERLADPGCGVFGVFVDGALVGMTGIYVTREDPTAAGLWGSWLAPEHRGRGLSVPMYEARIAWARARPELRRVLVSHRVGNEASRQANQKHGFVWTHSQDLAWRDGVTEPELCYVLDLERPT